jgi:diphosphomevalonate decarboxylase
LLGDITRKPSRSRGTGRAVANIALCKYWGKRQLELNLPRTSSLSISLDPLGSETTLGLSDLPGDQIRLNGREMPPDDPFSRRLSRFLDLFRPAETAGFVVETHNTIPTAAGLASSASGFAALVLALDDLFQWNSTPRTLSILARLGSGSAARSIVSGFVEWHAGTHDDGLDSFAESLTDTWPGLCIGLIEVDTRPKPVSSRQAMTDTVNTSFLYSSWPQQVDSDLAALKTAIRQRNFDQLGRVAEHNALSMHATMISAWPPILYWSPETIRTLHTIWRLRQEGVPVYVTMDAGPNIKLLFLEDTAPMIREKFPKVRIITPFAPPDPDTL